jgi:cytoskeletal protein RodZ
MKKITFSGVAIVIGLTGLVWCAVAVDSVTRVRGSGIVKTESRDVSGFSEIALIAIGEVHVERGDKDSLTVEAEDNVLPLLETTVKDGKLTLSPGSRTNINPTKPIVYRITTRQLDAVSISGSGSVHAAKVDAKTFSIAVSGSGKVNASGKADSLKIAISGSATADTSNLAVASARIAVSGSGKVTVNAQETLDVSVVGSGSIDCLGNPKIQKRITGAGRVTAKTNE